MPRRRSPVFVHRKHGGDRHDLADEYEADEQENEDHLEPLEAEEDEDEERHHDRRMAVRPRGQSGRAESRLPSQPFICAEPNSPAAFAENAML